MSDRTLAQTSWQAPSSVYSGYGTPYSHKHSAVKKFLIDDWFGFGYMRYSAPYYSGTGYQSSVYAPSWPGLFGPHCPLWFPFRPCYSLLGAKPYRYGPYNAYGGYGTYGNAGAYGPYGSGNTMPYSGYPCAPQCPPPACLPQNCCPQPICPPQPVCPPVAVRVPVTVCRPVTVDAGYYQQVWVPRPQTVMVPETRWQTQWVQPGQMQQMPGVTGTSGCSGPGCQPTFQGQTVPGTSMTPQPDVSFSAPTYHTPQASSMPLTQQPVAGVTGDIYGDHESATIPRTARTPIVPNSFSGTAPIVRTSYANRYPVTAQPQRRYSAVVR